MARYAYGGVQLENDNGLSSRSRLALVGLGASVAALLLTAGALSPDPRGFGTHEQLGFAPCTLVRWIGWRCPSCGMTTAWVYAVHGDWSAALQASVGGTLLCGLAALAGAWSIGSALAGRPLIGWPPLRWLPWIGGAWLTATLLDWLRKIIAD